MAGENDTIPNIKKYVSAIVKPFFKAWEQKLDSRMDLIRDELATHYEERITELETRVTELEGP